MIGKPVIPISLIEYCFREKIHSKLRVFLYLKTKSKGGYLRRNTSEFKQDLGISDSRTLHLHIDWLITNNWIGIDNRDILYIRSYKRLLQYYNLNRSHHIYLDNTKWILDNKIFRPFMFAASCTLLIRKLFYSNYFKDKENRRLRKKTRKLPSRSPYSFMLANSIISKHLNLSISGVSMYKKKARKLLLLKVKCVYEKSETIDPSMYCIYSEIMEECIIEGKPFPQIIRNDGILYFRRPDIITSQLALKRKRSRGL